MPSKSPSLHCVVYNDAYLKQPAAMRIRLGRVGVDQRGYLWPFPQQMIAHDSDLFPNWKSDAVLVLLLVKGNVP